MSANLTRHAVQRMSQRGFRDDDIALILLIGTAVEDGFIVLNRDREAALRGLKQLGDRIQRLGGKRVVIENNHVITAYRAGPETRRHLMRKAEEREIWDGRRRKWPCARLADNYDPEP